MVYGIMTDSEGNDVVVGMLCYADVGNILFIGVYDWDFEQDTYSLCCCVADIKCPVNLCESFYVIPWYDLGSVNKDDVEGFNRYLQNKINTSSLLAVETN